MEGDDLSVDGGGPGLLLRLGRLLLSAIFITGGLDAVREPQPKVPKVQDADLPVPRPTLTTQLNGAAMVAAGSALALGIKPKVAASVLAVSLVPTTIVGHPFWRMEDEQAATMQQIHFIKNLGLLGGLIGVIARQVTSRRWGVSASTIGRAHRCRRPADDCRQARTHTRALRSPADH